MESATSGPAVSGPTNSSEEKLELERFFVPFRLGTLNNRVTARVSQACRHEFIISASEWRTMAALAHYGSMPAKDVCNRTVMDKVRVSRAAVRLLERGYLSVTVDENDHRQRVLALTPQGKDVYGQVVPKVLAVEQQLTPHLSGDDRALLNGILRKLEQRVPTSSGDTEPIED